jgi:hypothetical protein
MQNRPQPTLSINVNVIIRERSFLDILSDQLVASCTKDFLWDLFNLKNANKRTPQIARVEIQRILQGRYRYHKPASFSLGVIR